MPGEVRVSAFIDQAEVRESKNQGTDVLCLQVFAKVFVVMQKGHPLLPELEASLGEKIDFTNEAQIAGLKGRDLRVHLKESENHDVFGTRVVVDDFRPIHPISENPDDTV